MHILAIHQGNELYGSDRSFIAALKALKPLATTLTVHLPNQGDISPHIEPLADKIIYGNLGVLRRGHVKSLLKKLPGQIWTAKRRADTADLLYINTAVVADYLIASRLTKTPAICHVREVPPEGKAAYILRGLLAFAGTKNIYNSGATQQAFKMPKFKKGYVVHNGIELSESIAPPVVEETINLLTIGRLNGWKGQDVLIEALALCKDLPIKTRIVGGVYEGQTHFRDNLQMAIEEHQLQDMVSLEGFTDNPNGLLEWSDVAIVPSKKPEPFGRVAVEAMAASRPVIATNHGGLTEIVQHNKTGLLCEPDNPKALANAIREMVTNRQNIVPMGAAGQQRYEEKFTENAYQQNIVNIIESIVKTTTTIG